MPAIKKRCKCKGCGAVFEYMKYNSEKTRTFCCRYCADKYRTENKKIPVLENQINLLNKYTIIDKECSMHIHLGGYPISEKQKQQQDLLYQLKQEQQTARVTNTNNTDNNAAE